MAKTSKRKRTASSSKSRRRSGAAPWMVLGLAVIAGILIHDHWKSLPKSAEISSFFKSTPPAAPKRPDVERTAAIPVPAAMPKALTAPEPRPAMPILAAAEATSPASSSPSRVVPVALTPSAEKASAAFGYCGQGAHVNCVAAGDMFWYKGEKIVVADIVAPQVESARCPEERRIAFAAKARLLALLNDGGFNINKPTASPRGDGARMLWRDGRSLGAKLVGEGLARRAGAPSSWCS